MKSSVLETLLRGTWRRFRASSEFPSNPVLDGIFSVLYSPVNPWPDVSGWPGPSCKGSPIGDVCIARALLEGSIVVCLKVAHPIGCPLQCMDCQGLEWRGNSWRIWSWPQWLLLIAVASLVGERAPGARASVVAARGLSRCGSRVLEHRLSSCGAWAYLLRGMWDLPGWGLEPMPSALAGGFLTTVPPGKSHGCRFFSVLNTTVLKWDGLQAGHLQPASCLHFEMEITTETG